MMLALLFATAALLHAAMFALSFRLKAGLPEWLVRLLFVGLMLDNTILALGAFAIDQPWYYDLSLVRYVAHVLILPPLVTAASGTLVRAGVEWAAMKSVQAAIWLFVLGAISFGYATELSGLQLVQETLFGHTRYVSAHASPPLATILTNLVLLTIAAILWKRAGWRWAFAGSLLIFVVNGASAGSDWGIVAGNIAEILFVASWLATLFRFRAK